MIALIRTEFRKVHTVRAPLMLLIAAQLVVVAGASGLLARGNASDPDKLPGAVAHVGLVSLFPLVVGIMAVGSEYRHRTITDTYLGTPRRDRVFLAKLVTNLAVGLTFGVLGVGTALLTALIWVSARSGSADWGGTDLWRTAAGGIVWNVLFAAIGVAIGALVRNLVAAIASALAWLALVEGVIGQVLGSGPARWLPFRAGSALGHLPGTDGLPQVGAGLLLAAYAVVLGVAAVLGGARRDIV